MRTWNPSWVHGSTVRVCALRWLPSEVSLSRGKCFFQREKVVTFFLGSQQLSPTSISFPSSPLLFLGDSHRGRHSKILTTALPQCVAFATAC